jgi:hypothetical protein
LSSTNETEEKGASFDANLNSAVEEAVSRKRAEVSVGAAEAEPAEAPATETAPQETPAAQPNWREVVLDGVEEYAFFNGKKVQDVIASYKHAETKLQEDAREKAELRRQLEQIQREREAEAAVKRVIGTTQPEPQKDDRDAKIDSLWFENPAEARRLLAERASEDARRVAQEELARAREAQEAQQRSQDAISAKDSAASQIAEMYRITTEEAQRRLLGASGLMMRHVQETGDTSIFLVPDNYVSAVKFAFGEPTTAQSAPAPTPAPLTVPDPPGTKRPAATNSRRPSEPSPLTAEKEDIIRELSRVTGADPDRAVKRAAARTGGARA